MNLQHVTTGNIAHLGDVEDLTDLDHTGICSRFSGASMPDRAAFTSSTAS
jgi:hypothetical protein